MITHARSALLDCELNIGPAAEGPSLLPLPPSFDPRRAADLYTVDTGRVGELAEAWAAENAVPPASEDDYRVCLLAVDGQVTFCHPNLPLFVSGETGLGAVEDIARLSRWIYQNAAHLSEIFSTLDTHVRNAIFHQAFWVGEDGEPPPLLTLVQPEDVTGGRWRVARSAVWACYGDLGMYDRVQRHAEEYTRRLAERGRYPLIIWPYHSRLGGLEHALMPTLFEACEWHAAARGTDVVFDVKGDNPLFEHYSVVSTEVEKTLLFEPPVNREVVDRLLTFDMVVVAGEASSHCVAWSVDDLLDLAGDEIARRLCILEDCTSAVVMRDEKGEVLPGGSSDFRPHAEAALARFEAAGVRRIRSTTPLAEVPGYGERPG